MSLKLVGAGLGRTGTHSLKLALEQVLGAPCYHMFEVLQHPDDIAHWQLAADGGEPDWEQLFSQYVATVDWQGASFWREISAVFPDAIVLLSVRPADEWWNSANRTIFEISRRPTPPDPVMQAQMRMVKTILADRFTPEWTSEGPAKDAYERHNAAVRALVPADRLVEWQPGDGWEPICDALGVPVPDAPFPHVNTSEEFRAMLHLDESPPPAS
jgi:hypothetical protein